MSALRSTAPTPNGELQTGSRAVHTGLAGSSPHALLSGGGTGGHVFPGLAVATELGRRGWQVSWAGSENGIEAKLVGQRGLPFFPLPAQPLVGRGMFAKAGALFTALRSAFLARSLVRRTKTRVVVGTGGYASVPAVLGGRLAGRPVLLLEPNAEVGVANRWLSRLASEAVVAHGVAAKALHCPAQTTGVPVRAEFFQGDQELPPGPPWRLLVLGGSQGARQLNEALPQALARLQAAGMSLAVTHQTGDRHQEATEEAYRAVDLSAESGGSVGVEVVPFLDDMAGAMAAHHLVISRAGAITLAEVCAAGRPALLVPLTLAAGHQLANALRLAEAGAAEVLAQDAGAEDLAKLLHDLLQQPERLRGMAAAAKKLAWPDAAERIADRVEHLANAGGRD